MSVYPDPWREITLAHTGDSATVIDTREEVLVEQEETLTFADGSASASYPIDSIVSSSWQYTDLAAWRSTGRI